MFVNEDKEYKFYALLTTFGFLYASDALTVLGADENAIQTLAYLNYIDTIKIENRIVKFNEIPNMTTPEALKYKAKLTEKFLHDEQVKTKEILKTAKKLGLKGVDYGGSY